MLDGFRYLAGNQVVLMSFVVDLIAMILGMPRALFPQMAHQSFGGPVEGGTTMALLAAAMSAGAVAGGVFSGWLPRIQRQGLAVVISIVVWGGAMIGFGVAGGFAHGHAGAMLWIALAFLAVGGAADMVSAAFRSTILQQVASDELRGRLQGVFTVVVAGGPRLADAVHGAAAAAVGHDGRRRGRWRAGGGRRGDRRAGCACVRPLPGGRGRQSVTDAKCRPLSVSKSIHSLCGLACRAWLKSGRSQPSVCVNARNSAPAPP